MLDQTGLRDRAGDAVGTLSGGNQQRVNIAVGLLGDPAVLLLDEPSSSLDPRQRERLWEFVAALAREGGTTVVFSTHNVAEAERYADRCSCSPTASCCSPARRRSSSARPASTRRSTSRARSSASCASGGTDDALAAAQGPADPAPVAAARRRCSCSTRWSSRCWSAPRCRPARRSRRSRSPTWSRRRGEDRARRPAAGRDDVRARALRGGRSDPRRLARGGDREGRAPARRSARSSIPPDVIERLQGTLALGGGDPPDGRGLLQRREPAQAPLRRGDDRRDARGREQGALRRDLQGGGGLPEPDRRRGRALAAGRRRRRHPRAAQRAGDHRRGDRRTCRRTRRARRAAAGLALRRSSPRTTSTSQADPRLDRQPGRGRGEGDRRLGRVARRVRRRGRGRRSR